jgi:hypothetical protein
MLGNLNNKIKFLIQAKFSSNLIGKVYIMLKLTFNNCIIFIYFVCKIIDKSGAMKHFQAVRSKSEKERTFIAKTNIFRLLE